MRTNTSGLALTVGMGLLVILVGFGALSAAGLVGFAAEEALAEQNKQWNKENKKQVVQDFYCQGPGPTGRTHVPASAKEFAAIRKGDALFKNNCMQCHAVSEQIVGPALAGITKRRSTAWIVSWVHNPAKVVASGDTYAAQLYREYDKQQMPAFKLSEREIKDIIAYISNSE